jgi:hypothetical protein
MTREVIRPGAVCVFIITAVYIPIFALTGRKNVPPHGDNGGHCDISDPVQTPSWRCHMLFRKPIKEHDTD